MGRAEKFPREVILDAALALLAQGGPAAVTVPRVAECLGAPSGSIYHRFEKRDDLLVSLWLRTAEEFQRGFIAALEDGDPAAGAIEAVRFVFRWARRNPRHAQLLMLYRTTDLVRERWPAAHATQASALRAQLRSSLASWARRAGVGTDRAAFLLVDLPYAGVRRSLMEGRTPGHAREALVLETVTTMLRETPG